MFAELFLVISVLLSIVSIYFYSTKFMPLSEKTKDWISLPTYPVIGSAHLFFRLPSSEILLYLIELLREYDKDKCVKFWFGWELTLIIVNPRDLEIVMTSTHCIEKSKQYTRLADWLREGLLISKGKKWYQRRKLLTPAFHFSILKDYVDVSERQSRIFIEKLNKYAKSGRSFDIFHEGGLLALDVICETAMGVTIEAQANADSEYVNAVKIISHIMHKRTLDILHFYPVIHSLTNLRKLELKALAILHGFSEKVIKQRRALLLNSEARKQANDDEMTQLGIKRRISFLDLLLQSQVDGKPLSEIDIREEVDTFMFEGHDTTSSAISFFFYNMAVNPQYQQKCFEEILNVFGNDKSKPATYEDLNKLNFVELCIKETLRLFPSVPIIGRKAAKDIHLTSGKIVPAGCNVATMPIYVMRCEEYFPEPNKFKPERFDIERSAEQINPFSFLPFSAGQRNCIGQKFALLELKTIIANVLRNFVVTYDGDPSKDLFLTGELILRTKYPLLLKVSERKY